LLNVSIFEEQLKLINIKLKKIITLNFFTLWLLSKNDDKLKNLNKFIY